VVSAIATTRELTVAETAQVSGGEWNDGEFLGSVIEGAAIGVPIGMVLVAPVGIGFGAVVGGFVGGFFGGAYYSLGELIEYCY
jgi:hypothetical protein